MKRHSQLPYLILSLTMFGIGIALLVIAVWLPLQYSLGPLIPGSILASLGGVTSFSNYKEWRRNKENYP